MWGSYYITNLNWIIKDKDAIFLSKIVNKPPWTIGHTGDKIGSLETYSTVAVSNVNQI